MPRVPAVLLSSILGAASAVLMISCGSSGGGVPPTSANAMLAQLNAARQSEADGDCQGVRTAAANLSRQAGTITAGDVKIAIQRGAANLAALAAQPSACGTTTSEKKKTTTATTTPTTTATTTSSTTKPTTSTTSTTKPTTTTTTQPQPPTSGGTHGRTGGG